MASIELEVDINARPELVWDALRDIGALHTRLCPNFVTDTRLEEGARIVTFASGSVARELILDVSDERRRVAWSIVGNPQISHHNGSAQVFDAGNGRTRFVWIADVLPHEVAPVMRGWMEKGIQDVKTTLER